MVVNRTTTSRDQTPRLARAEMDGADTLQQCGDGNRPRRWLSPDPGVVPALRHAEDAGHGGDREIGLVRAHEPEDPHGRTPVSCANQTVARASKRMSRSNVSCRFPRRSLTKASLIYEWIVNLRAGQIVLGHIKIESEVRYLDVDVEDALPLAEGTEI